MAAAAIQGNPNFQFLILESFQLSYELANGLAESYPNRLSGHLGVSLRFVRIGLFRRVHFSLSENPVR